MPYLGTSPTQAGSFIFLDDIASSFNNNATAFNLAVGGVAITPNTQNLLIALDGVIQQAPDAYTVSGSTITFTSAVPSGTDFYGILMGQSASVGQGTIGADELKITGNGTSGQSIISDGDSTFSYTNHLPLAGGTMTGALNMNSQNITNAGTIQGTLATAAQTNITSVGTLSSLNTTGAVTATGSDYMLKAVSTSTTDGQAIRISAESGVAQGKIEIDWFNDSSRTGGGYGLIQVGKSANSPEISIMASKTLVGTTTAYRTNERLQVTGGEGIASKATTNGGGAFVAVEDSGNTSGSAFVNVDTGGNVNFKVGVGGYTTITGGTSATPLTIFRGDAGNLIQVGPTNTAHDASIYLRSNGIFNFHTPGGGSIRFSPGGSTGLTLDSSQNATLLGILTVNNTGSSSYIDIDGNTVSGEDGRIYIKGHTSSNSRAFIYFNNGQTSGGTNWYLGALRGSQNFALSTQDDYNTGTNVFAVDSNRRIGINTGPSSSYRVAISGTVYADTTSQFAATLIGNVTISGTQFAMIGSNSTSRGIALCRDGSASLPDFRINGDGSAQFNGSVSKGSGSFKIDHPLPSKKDTHYLVHSFTESPRADLIYRDKVKLVKGKATVNIDEVAGMTEGTFVLLCDDVQCFTSNESNWDAVKGSVKGNILTIECQNSKSTANVSWMVIADRKDQHMMDTNWTDKNGKPIIEPLKETALEGN